MVACGTEPAARSFGPEAVLGRTSQASDGAMYDIDDDRMSREHARVRFDRGQWVIADQGSRNGTFVNGQPITGEVRRRGTTILRLGHSVFVLLPDASGHPVAGDACIGPELARAYARIRDAATRPALLVHAEPGAGREAAARVFHDAGPRRASPFIAVSCPSIPEALSERLLFGAKHGVVERIGQFQMARGGTIFLDDISVLVPNVQARLLQLLERSDLDVGVVAGAHAELRLAVAHARFDPALYRWLAEITVPLPALRERVVDLARLVQREVAGVDAKLRAHAKLVEACLIRQWPGNLRELQIAIRTAAHGALAEQRDVVHALDLDAAAGLANGALAAETAVERPRDTPPDGLDKPAIEAAPARAQGVVHLAARVLGVHRNELYRLMDEHGIVFTDDA